MQHEIIIKNGIAGVEINGRFYTYTDKHSGYYRMIDVDVGDGVYKYVAAPSIDGEIVFLERLKDLTPIQNPVLDWPKGTKVMVRNSDQCRWVSRVFHSVDDGDILCEVPKSKTMVDDWKQCKLAVAE